MDFIKQYITQSINAASNNLRLNTQQIEIIALLKNVIIKSEDLGNDLISMKKITELSTLSIRLNEIYNYLTQNQVDLLKVSDTFKEHSRYLIKDLSYLVENVSLPSFQKAIEKINFSPLVNDEIKIDFSKRQVEEELFVKPDENTQKEKLVLEEISDDEDLFFHNYEVSILKPIKSLDTMLKGLIKNEIDHDQLSSFSKLMQDNGKLSTKIGFEIIANMHWIIAKALNLIKTRDLMPGREVIESIRACLIVIVAVVKGKEVDISNYLNRAEEFGNHLSTIKLRE